MFKKSNGPEAESPEPLAAVCTVAANWLGAEPEVGYRAPCRCSRWTCSSSHPEGIWGSAVGRPNASLLTENQGPRLPQERRTWKGVPAPLYGVCGATNG